jgi:hypothetical protein
MAVQSNTSSAPALASEGSEVSQVYLEGITAGLLGAAAIALWFFIVDAAQGRPFYTPNLLGSVLLRHDLHLESIDAASISFETVLIYTWVHGLAFCVLGGITARLLALAERQASYGFGILLLFVIFEFGFIAGAFIFAEPILHALAWPAILFGNLLAAAAMATYFLRRHPNLSIRP